MIQRIGKKILTKKDNANVKINFTKILINVHHVMSSTIVLLAVLKILV